MTCDNVKKLLDDYSSGKKADWADDALDAVDEHLRTCENCRKEEKKREKTLGPILLATALEFGRPNLGILSAEESFAEIQRKLTI
ncbi:hypothetical protein JW979_09300 [bacterium]|nr:hypothetical protein [candidate division CSSED10-310 bacterium]